MRGILDGKMRIRPHVLFRKSEPKLVSLHPPVSPLPSRGPRNVLADEDVVLFRLPAVVRTLLSCADWQVSRPFLALVQEVHPFSNANNVATWHMPRGVR